ncbi:MAG: hypothetical protein HOI35_00420 [Woeseia sp.]|jgi:glyoxylase I family protein|nr:hypothetical protein [Woeseia sp.]
MSKFTVIRTNHTGITVSDMESTLDFFRDVLCMNTSEIVEHKSEMVERLTGVPGAQIRIAFVDLPGHQIELIQYLNPTDTLTSELRHCDAGAFHIALEVDDIEAATDAAESAGYVALGEPQIVPEGPRKGNRNVYLRNSDGIVIEFQMSARRSNTKSNLSG